MRRNELGTLAAAPSSTRARALGHGGRAKDTSTMSRAPVEAHELQGIETMVGGSCVEMSSARSRQLHRAPELAHLATAVARRTRRRCRARPSKRTNYRGLKQWWVVRASKGTWS